MKKNLLMLFLAICCAFSITACTTGNEETEPVVVEETEIETTEENGVELETEGVTETEFETQTIDEKEIEESIPDVELSGDLFDFQVSVNGIVHQFPMWYSDFEELGWTYEGDSTQTISSEQYTSSEYWKKDGYEVGVSFANLSVNSVPYSEAMIGEIKFHEQFLANSGWEIILPGNIQWGVSTVEDIKNAYGEPTIEYEEKQYYQLLYVLDAYREVELKVRKDTNVLGIIRITNMVELEEIDNSIDSAIPEVVQNYVLPTSLGNDFYEYNVEFEGQLYSLPCPVSVFLANGFEVDEEKSDMELAANDIGSIRLNYNGKIFESSLINFADYATTVDNCFVTSVATYEMNNLDFSLVTPGNIKLGSTEEELIKAIEGFNYREDEKQTGITYYSVFPSDDKVMNDYEFGVDNGVITSIVVKNIDMPN